MGVYKAIHENIDKYIERKGKPQIHRGFRRWYVVFRNIFLLKDPMEYYYPSDYHIKSLLDHSKHWVKSIIMRSEVEKINKESKKYLYELKDKLNWKRDIEFFKCSISVQSRKSDYVLETWRGLSYKLENLIYNMGIQEEQVDDKSDEYEKRKVDRDNSEWQPSLRNALAFQNYFKLRKETEKLGIKIDFDERLAQELERIPLELGSKDISLEELLSERKLIVKSYK